MGGSSGGSASAVAAGLTPLARLRPRRSLGVPRVLRHAPAVQGAEAPRQVAEAEQGAAAHARAAVPGELRTGVLGPDPVFGPERHLDHQALELDRFQTV